LSIKNESSFLGNCQTKKKKKERFLVVRATALGDFAVSKCGTVHPGILKMVKFRKLRIPQVKSFRAAARQRGA